MSDLAVSWVAAAPSAWRHRLRASALGVAAGVLVGLGVMHVSESSLLAALAGGLAAALVALFAFGDAPVATARAWKIAPGGQITIRVAPGDERTASVRFVSAVLIVLRGDGASVEIWRDATPIRPFRRLSVAARWSATRHRDAALTAVKPSR